MQDKTDDELIAIATELYTTLIKGKRSVLKKGKGKVYTLLDEDEAIALLKNLLKGVSTGTRGGDRLYARENNTKEVQNEGRDTFLKMLDEQYPNYMAATKKTEKNRIAEKVLNEFRVHRASPGDSPGERRMMKLDPFGFKIFVPMEDDVSIDKIKQDFRDKTKMLQSKETPKGKKRTNDIANFDESDCKKPKTELSRDFQRAPIVDSFSSELDMFKNALSSPTPCHDVNTNIPVLLDDGNIVGGNTVSLFAGGYSDEADKSMFEDFELDSHAKVIISNIKKFDYVRNKDDVSLDM